ncbi:hypothetical protein [Bradyrhizobium sp.]|jgi:hypothetical protein|uniref:hypothetical protein n=1 Tax=Bradyrhizobium sp. TaxID=376 RepID=UPI002E0971BD|nr:hypothetical protein [Bradyrhizobium sp.]
MELTDFLASKYVPYGPPNQSDVDDGGERELKAYILAHDDNDIRILHFQTEYLIAKSDVLDVSQPDRIFASSDTRGFRAQIRLRPNAAIRSAFSVPAKDFFAEAPFAFQVPSWADAVEPTFAYPNREKRWLMDRGLVQEPPATNRPLYAGMTDQYRTETTASYSGTAVGTLPDIHVKAGDHDDDNEKQVWDGQKNDDPIIDN